MMYSALADMLPARAAANDRQMMEACVDYSLVELIRTGTTTVMEIGGIGDYVADATERTGLRAYVADSYRSGRWYSDDGRSVKYEWDEAKGMRVRVVLNADEGAIATRLQRDGERMWPRMHEGDWAGRNVDEMSPPTYPAFETSLE